MLTNSFKQAAELYHLFFCKRQHMDTPISLLSKDENFCYFNAELGLEESQAEDRQLWYVKTAEFKETLKLTDVQLLTYIKELISIANQIDLLEVDKELTLMLLREVLNTIN